MAANDFAGWAVLEWECALKHPEQGAAEGAPFIARHIIQVTERAFDDFAAGGADRAQPQADGDRLMQLTAAFVRNLWYLAAWSEEVPAEGWLVRRLLGQSWLLLRGSDGNVAILADRCPHRFVALSKGTREGERIVCGYHGLGFALDGRCVHSPFPGVSPEARIATMPAVERHLGVWFWPGDPELADPARNSRLLLLEGDRPAERGHLVIKGNYELMTDNLMDLTHAEFIHRESFGVNGSIFGGKQTVVQDDDGAIRNNWDMPDSTRLAGPRRCCRRARRSINGSTCAGTPRVHGLADRHGKSGNHGPRLVVPPMRNPHIVTPETQQPRTIFTTMPLARPRPRRRARCFSRKTNR